MTLLDTADSVEPDVRPDWQTLVVIAVAAVAFDHAVRSGVASLAGALFIAVVGVGLAGGGRLYNPQARAAAAFAPVFGFFLAWRDSPWLLLPDIAAAGLLLLVAAAFAREGSVADMAAPAFVRRLFEAGSHVLGVPGFVVESWPVRRREGNALAVARGLLFAAPIVVVLGLILSSADVVFASFFRVSPDPSWLGMHLGLGVIGAFFMGTLLRASAHPGMIIGGGPLPVGVAATGVAFALVALALLSAFIVVLVLAGIAVALGWGAHRLLQVMGTIERSVALAAIVALYAAFALAQVVAANEGGERVLKTAGLTYAEYARSGFFQLLVVAVLTLVVLFALDNGTPVVRALSGAAVVLTLLIVAVAVHRLHLYEEAFGLTMERLCAVVFAVWIGAVFVLFGARLLGIGGQREWWAPAAVGAGLAMLLVLNVMNPEALVTRRNAAREKFDVAYAASLSADAVPELVARGFHREVCPRPDRGGWTGWNRSQDRAEAACRRAQPGAATQP